jgi:hypothetical protein
MVLIEWLCSAKTRASSPGTMSTRRIGTFSHGASCFRKAFPAPSGNTAARIAGVKLQDKVQSRQGKPS